MSVDRMQAMSWYRVPVVWLLVAFPLLAVASAFILLTLAIKSDDGLVVDDYYRRGKEINLELKRDRAAAARGAVADMMFDKTSNNVQIQLKLSASQLPNQLHMQIMHATLQGNDRELLLARSSDGVYRAALLGLVPGHYYIQLAADDWRLLGSMRLPDDRQVQLLSAFSSR